MRKKVVYYHELRKFIKAQGMNFKQYAQNVLHIDPMSLTYRFTGRVMFSVDDIKLTRDYFGLEPAQIDIFFLRENIK